MTDRQGALTVLCGLEPLREEKLADFRALSGQCAGDRQVVLASGRIAAPRAGSCEGAGPASRFHHAATPTGCARYMALAVNPAGFHDAGGEGYRMIGDLILRWTRSMPRRRRVCASLGRWRGGAGARRMMKAQLERIVAQPGLSKDVFEQVSKSLG
jgi:aminopeptidase N